MLGPLLALIYLDGLSNRTKNDVLFFADDTSLYASHTTNDINVIERTLQDDLDEIQKYGREWAITFNAAKTVQQTFSRKHERTLPTRAAESMKFHRLRLRLRLRVEKIDSDSDSDSSSDSGPHQSSHYE